MNSGALLAQRAILIGSSVSEVVLTSSDNWN